MITTPKLFCNFDKKVFVGNQFGQNVNFKAMILKATAPENMPDYFLSSFGHLGYPFPALQRPCFPNRLAAPLLFIMRHFHSTSNHTSHFPVYSYCRAISRFSRAARSAGTRAARMITARPMQKLITNSVGCNWKATVWPSSTPEQRLLM